MGPSRHRTRLRSIAALGILIGVLPLHHVVRGPDAAPFAGDLAADPRRYAGRDVVLTFRGVAAVGDGFVEIADAGGRVRAEAGTSFAFLPGESVDVRLRGSGDGFEVMEVRRHPSRSLKYLVSAPVLAGVGLLALARVRWDPPRRGLRLAGGTPCRTS